MRSDVTYNMAAVEPKQVIPSSAGRCVVIVQQGRRLTIPRSLYRRTGLTGEELVVCALMDGVELVVGTLGLVLEMERWSVLPCAVNNDGIRLPRKAVQHLRLQSGDTVIADIRHRHLSLLPYHRRTDQGAARKRGRARG